MGEVRHSSLDGPHDNLEEDLPPFSPIRRYQSTGEYSQRSIKYYPTDSENSEDDHGRGHEHDFTAASGINVLDLSRPNNPDLYQLTFCTPRTPDPLSALPPAPLSDVLLRSVCARSKAPHPPVLNPPGPADQ